MISTTEITSHEEESDNVIHQRLYYAYIKAAEIINGNVLEIGCGAGRGTELMVSSSDSYTGIDKNEVLIKKLSEKYPDQNFVCSNIPPIKDLEDDSFDYVVTFQVIEHIKNDSLFLKEIRRVLKPSGKVILTTPNIKMTLTRNPWHVREYTAQQLQKLMSEFFGEVEVKGITGNEKVMEYYEENKVSVKKITKYDIFNLQYNLPRFLIRIPYEILNRVNRKRLMKQNKSLVSNVSLEDYVLSDNPEGCFDLFCIARK